MVAFRVQNHVNEPIDTVFYRPSQPLSIKLTIEGLSEVFLHVGRMGKETLESEHYKTINVTNLTLYLFSRKSSVFQHLGFSLYPLCLLITWRRGTAIKKVHSSKTALALVGMGACSAPFQSPSLSPPLSFLRGFKAPEPRTSFRCWSTDIDSPVICMRILYSRCSEVLDLDM